MKSNRPIGPSFELKNYETNPSGFFVSDRPDFQGGLCFTPRFAREGREIAPGLRRLGRCEGRSARDEVLELQASSQRVEGRILPRRQGKR